MYSQGVIFYFTPFYFKDGNPCKPKYLIVLVNNNGENIVVSLPTRKDSLPSQISLNHGCINDNSISVNCYHFKKEEKICDNGFSFPIDTFIYGYSVDLWEITLLDEIYKTEGIDYEIMGTLTESEYQSIIKCFANSTSVKGKFRKVFQKTLNSF